MAYYQTNKKQQKVFQTATPGTQKKNITRIPSQPKKSVTPTNCLQDTEVKKQSM